MRRILILTQRICVAVAFIISGYMLQQAHAETMSTEKEWVTISKDCKYWTYPHKDVTWTWSGKCVNGYVEGYGILQQHAPGFKDENIYYRFEGNMVRGVENGSGFFTIGGVAGYKVEGQFDNGSLDSPCRITWNEGAHFEGICKNGSPFTGKETLSDGSVSTIVAGELKSNSAFSNTSSAKGKGFGSVFKALLGTVVSVKTGDSTLLNEAIQETYNIDSNSSTEQSRNMNPVSVKTQPGKDGTQCLKLTYEQASATSIVNVYLLNNCNTMVYATSCQAVKNRPTERTCADGSWHTNLHIAPGSKVQLTYLMSVKEVPPIYGGCLAPATVTNVSYDGKKLNFNCVIDDTPPTKGTQ